MQSFGWQKINWNGEIVIALLMAQAIFVHSKVPFIHYLLVLEFFMLNGWTYLHAQKTVTSSKKIFTFVTKK